jgi:hypothetical protein
MRKLQIADAEVMQIAIQWEMGRNEESCDDHRLHGPPRVTAGRPRCQVTELFDEDDDATLGCAAPRWLAVQCPPEPSERLSTAVSCPKLERLADDLLHFAADHDATARRASCTRL